MCGAFQFFFFFRLVVVMSDEHVGLRETERKKGTRREMSRRRVPVRWCGFMCLCGAFGLRA